MLLGIALSSVTLWLSFRKLNWRAVGETFGSVNFLWIAGAVGLSLLMVYVLGWRWKILLMPREKLSLWSLFRLNIIGQYVNILTPWRFGDIARAYLASKEAQKSPAFIMGTVAAEKILDFLVLMVLWCIAPIFLSIGVKAGENKVAGILLFTGIATIGFFSLYPGILVKIAARVVGLIPDKIGRPILDFVREGIEAFGQLKSPKILFSFTLITFILLLGQILTNLLVFKALGINLALWPSLLVFMAIQVGNIPPSVPGKLGIFEYAVILALSAFPLSREQAFSYAIVLHAVAYVPKILLGAALIGAYFLRK